MSRLIGVAGKSEREEIRREQEAARRRPLFDEDRIAKAHKEYLRQKQENAKNAGEYGYSGVLRKR